MKQQGKPKIVAIIPARGGSKSIPLKNIRPLGGFPLIAYSIAAGLASDYVDRVLVSTDSPEISALAKTFGAECPFLRPAELAGDTATDFPVFEHALHWLETEEGYRPDLLVQLRPTSPFRPTGLVDAAIEAMLRCPEADSLRGVTVSGQNPYKMWRVQDGFMQPLLDTPYAEPYNMPRQALPETYWQTGQIEVIRRATILEQKSLTGKMILSHVLPPEYAIDLDNLYQWEFAEHVLKTLNLDLVLPEKKSCHACKHS
ncbi:MAG: acylneuraminate cytidylyltransferase family protein [Lewinellaceae bacterium]|nr:acylneuraminate cytidylyltransferase family protein [Lewinellaceae bacterium]